MQMQQPMWSERLEDEDERGITIAYRAKAINIEALVLEPRIVYVEHDDEIHEDVMGIQIVASCDDMELTRETHWGIGLVGDPNITPNKEFLDEVLSSLAPFTVYQAHINMRAMHDRTAQRLKELKEVKEKLSFVTLHHGESRMKLSLGMAQQILFIKMRDKARANIKPFRLQTELPDVAVIFDAQNRVMGRIGFDPTVEKYHHAEGRFGLFNLPD